MGTLLILQSISAEVRGSDRAIHNMANEAGVEISDRKLLADGTGKPGTDSDSYLKMMLNNTCAIMQQPPSVDRNCLMY